MKERNIKLKGFSYEIPKEKMEESIRWLIEKRLEWLYQAARLRNLLPTEIVRIQDEFRKGKR